MNVDLERLRQLRTEGKRVKEIADYFNCEAKTINKLCTKHKILNSGQLKRIQINEYFTYDVLYDLLHVQGYSANYIAQNISPVSMYAGDIIERAKTLGISTHSITQSCNLQHVKNAKRDTCIDRYGSTNPSGSEIIKERKRQTFLKNYGVDNVRKSPRYKEYRDKIMLERYGVTNMVMHPDYAQNCGRISKFHQEVADSISQTYRVELEVANLCKGYNAFTKRPYSPIVDILLPDHKIIVECYGSRWHASPRIYKPDDILKMFTGYQTAQYIWDYDNAREEQIKTFGYKLIIVWEDLFRLDKSYITQILDEIKNHITKEN